MFVVNALEPVLWNSSHPPAYTRLQGDLVSASRARLAAGSSTRVRPAQAKLPVT